ncbi:TPA: hypothetical protein N2817_004507 [Vibrio parahaemolyticus]|nr:hypothetical protein [Vibrio parahaemolyticus]
MNKNKRVCAFCGSSGDLSREHIFPNGVIRKYEKEMLSINDKSDRTFKSDLVVKDVCESCNNGELSQIDAPFVALYEQYMLQPKNSGDSVTFEFDYNLLLRELLKISYNSARASSDGLKATNALKRYVPYILGKVGEANDVHLRLQIVTSSKALNTETNESEDFTASLLRSAKMEYNGHLNSSFRIRLVAFNSFWFYLIVPLKKVSSSRRQAFIDGFIDSYHLPGVPIEPTMSSVTIPKEKTTYMHPALLEGMRRK